MGAVDVVASVDELDELDELDVLDVLACPAARPFGVGCCLDFGVVAGFDLTVECRFGV